ncbi:MFS transporter [Martelella alba]|uniref:MFS transporter n=1 Tax=Martelella alba TaxID=2590451 RepID=A0ABY2SIU0_9HYPH|nr:MFS transporter [Martelella alba]TKI04490.1 MFS transporter [Martelella alba]
MIKVLLVLMLGAFVSQTTEYLPIGLLTRIADDLQVNPAEVGILVTGYAWIITLTVIPITLLTNHIDRRPLFLVLLGIITLCNGLALFTHTWGLLMALRIVAALGHGVFWSSLASYAVRIAPDMPASRATAWVFSGISLSIVGGVPLATALGQAFDWQQGFAVFGACGLLILIMGYFWLPSVKINARGGASFPRRNWPLYGAALATLLIITAHFNGYTYITPLAANTLGLHGVLLPLALLVFGLAGAAGTLLAGWLSPRPIRLAAGSAAAIVVSQLLMLWLARYPGVPWLVMAMWGAAIAMLIIGLQSWVIELAPEQAEAASALYVMTFNIGIGAGAMSGGVWMDHFGAGMLLRMGSGLGVVALCSFLLPAYLQRRRKARSSRRLMR